MNQQDNNSPIMGAAIAAATAAEGAQGTTETPTNTTESTGAAEGTATPEVGTGAAEGTTESTASTDTPKAKTAKLRDIELTVPMFALAMVLLVAGIMLATFGINALLTFLFGEVAGAIMTMVLLIAAEWWLFFSRKGFDKVVEVYFGFFGTDVNKAKRQADNAAGVQAQFDAQAPAEADLAAAAGL